MTDNQVRIVYLIKKLRRKYEGDRKLNDQLSAIVWHSLPIVYPEWEYESKTINHAAELRKGKKRRTRKYLHTMYEVYQGDLHFITLTFNDEVLNSTNEKTRHRYVTAYLNSISRCYYGNVDYGSANEREHYHAVANLSASPLPEWKYGFWNVKSVRKSKKGLGDVNSIATYMNKLTNHANKLTTGRSFHSRYMVTDGEYELPF